MNSAAPPAPTDRRGFGHEPAHPPKRADREPPGRARIKLEVFELDGFVDLEAGSYGDAPNDVRAALDAGVRVIGVATGKTSAEGLREAGAALVAKDLVECRELLEHTMVECAVSAGAAPRPPVRPDTA